MNDEKLVLTQKGMIYLRLCEMLSPENPELAEDYYNMVEVVNDLCNSLNKNRIKPIEEKING